MKIWVNAYRFCLQNKKVHELKPIKQRKRDIPNASHETFFESVQIKQIASFNAVDFSKQTFSEKSGRRGKSPSMREMDFKR